MKHPSLLWISLMLACAGASHAVTFSYDRATLVRGKEAVFTIVPDSVTVRLGDSLVVRPGDPSGWMVIVEYFPNSKVMRDDTLGFTDSLGRVKWTPEFAGIATVTASRGNKRVRTAVSVKFPHVPAGAVVVFLIAGIILIGGAGWSLIRLAEHEPPHGLDEDREERGKGTPLTELPE